MRIGPTMPSVMRPWWRLGAACLVITIVWVGLLPWIAAQKPFASHIERMERQDIVVEAMFYSELNWQPPDGAAWRK